MNEKGNSSGRKEEEEGRRGRRRERKKTHWLTERLFIDKLER